MLHQRRVPFLLVSWKCNTHRAHFRTPLRSVAANNAAALCANGAKRSLGSRASNHSSVESDFPSTFNRVRMGCAAITRFSSRNVESRTLPPFSQATTCSLSFSRSCLMAAVVCWARFDPCHFCLRAATSRDCRRPAASNHPSNAPKSGSSSNCLPSCTGRVFRKSRATWFPRKKKRFRRFDLCSVFLTGVFRPKMEHR